MGEPVPTTNPPFEADKFLGRSASCASEHIAPPGGLSELGDGHGQEQENIGEAIPDPERPSEEAVIQDRERGGTTEASADGPAARSPGTRTTVTALDKMSMAPRIKLPIDLTLEFRYALVDLLSGPMGRRIAIQLIAPSSFAAVKEFIGRKFPIKPKNVLRRFLSGEFTDGIEPVRIPSLQKLDIAKLLRVLDVIECMAEEHDRKKINDVTEKQDGTHIDTAGAATSERHHVGNDGNDNRRRRRKTRRDNASVSSGG